jgi:Tfp pilus assembly protein PilX
MRNNTKLLCLFLRTQKIDKSSEQGYAMAMVSLLTIVLFSLLAAGLVFSNLARSRTDAFVDNHSSFAVAESGLNKRASEFKAKLETYSGVAGIGDLTGSQGLANCFGVAFPTTGAHTDETSRSSNNDFECRNYRFKSSNTTSHTFENNTISFNTGQDANGNDRSASAYIAYTMVADLTSYAGASPPFTMIPAGDPFAGLNAAEYKYVLYSTAKKPVAVEGRASLPNYTNDEIAAANRQQRGVTPIPANDAVLIASYNSKKAAATTAASNAVAAAVREVGESTSNTNLSTTFLNRVVPLFQFGIFYNGDIEFNSTSPMSVNGRVHSNANIYVQPAGVATLEANSVTTFLARVSAAGQIYNRVDAWATGVGRTGIVNVLLTGNNCLTANNCLPVPNYDVDIRVPLSTTQINAFNGQLQDRLAGAVELTTPVPGFTRKRNYVDNRIGEYYAKADMRLDFVPDRDVTSKATAPWIRNQSIIPFNFTSITTNTGTTCSTTAPTAGNDPAADYILPSRELASTRRCNRFTKGQLQSLRQPVLVLTAINQSAALATSEGTTLGKPAVLPNPPALTPLAVTPPAPAVTDAQKNQILRALQVALVSTPQPISLDRLGISFALMTTGSELTFRTTFNNLILQIFPINTGNLNTDQVNQRHINDLLGTSPNQIAALRNAWFLPAPIQRVETANVQDAANTTTPSVILLTPNPRSSGFFDGRERRWISMLQTNIASLSVWNRDGLYVNSDNETLTTPYATTNTAINLAFNNGAGANPSNGLAFDRPNADGTKPDGSFQSLGLGSNDTTEGGLVVHASVNDDLNGDGVMDANDVTTNTVNPLLKKNPDNTNYINPDTGRTETVDYFRQYPGITNTQQSPFAFAVNGGDYLPNNLMFSTDQSVYIQGNFNNNNNAQPTAAGALTRNYPVMQNSTANTPSIDRLPAGIVADTITVLSNQCVSQLPGAGVPPGQLNCGIKDGFIAVTSPLAINAAFLANTDVSNGNLGVNRNDGSGNLRFSGGVNNYIRLLEDWNNAFTINYTGSLVSLGAPLEYSGAYKSGGLGPVAPVGNPTFYSYYNIPLRNFNYDTNFNTVNNMPPLTPRASYVRHKIFSQAH